MKISVPKISIVIPSLNKAGFIKRTLESIFLQHYPNLEIIIMDGGSTDGTLKIIKKYANEYPQIIRYQSKKDKGQWDAINRGFRMAKGKIMAYINADDEYLPGAFSEIEKMYRANVDALWFAGRGRVVDGYGIRIATLSTYYKNLLLTINHHQLLLIVNYLMQPSVFISKSVWKRFGPFIGHTNFVLEYDLWLKISQVKMPIVTDRYLSSFRIEKNTITKTSSDLLLKEDEKILKKYTEDPIIIFLHRLHNLGRLALAKFV